MFKRRLWKIILHFGEWLSRTGDGLLIKSLDGLNDVDKAEWLKTYRSRSTEIES